MVKKGFYLEIISILWMLIETAVALAAGIAAKSLALVAFGADSVIELVAGAVLLWRLSVELRSGSTQRVERAEKTASWIVGLALLLLAVYILVSALYNLFGHASAEASLPGLLLAVASGILMPILAAAKRRAGKAIGSAALMADAACSMVCAWMSWVLILGLAATSLLGLWWMDSAASLAFLYFVIREGLEALREAREEE